MGQSDMIFQNTKILTIAELDALKSSGNAHGKHAKLTEF